MEKKERGLSRREFMKVAGVTAAGMMASTAISDKLFAAAPAPAPGRVIGANDRINVAFVGVGGQGQGHVARCKGMEADANISVVAVCDVYDKHIEEAAGHGGITSDTGKFKDYRKILENKDIDAVVIATPDHWHAPIAIAAMEAGKHVYIEKPMTHTFEEAVKLASTAKKTNKVVQVGSQGCTDAKWHKAGELVKAGRIGNVIWAQGGYCRNNPNGEWNYTIEPEANEKTVDWKMWLGNAPKIPWNPDHFFRWRKFWAYGTGIIGDLWPHRLHPLMIAMALDEFPKRVACIGKDICHTDQGNGEARDVADATMCIVEFPNGAQIFLCGSTVNERGVEDMIRGNKANLYFGGGKVQVRPERPYADEIEEADEPVVGPGEDINEHMKNWFSVIRNGGTPNCGIDLALRVQTIVSMAEKSYRENKMAMFDAKAMKIV